jgi:hydroxypyruvate reductase
MLSGGETTVTVKGNGLGGRNQEFALAAARAMEGWEEALLLSAGTDGIDGASEAAGAFADGRTCLRARSQNLDPDLFLKENDSNSFFSALGGLLVTGATGTNVMDVQILLCA